MSCVNNHYSPAELESIFLWDCLCEALPLTAEERREINGRDHTPDPGKRKHRAKSSAIPITPEKIRLEEDRRKRQLEKKRLWREANKERIRAYDAAYRAKNRDAINERQREYDRAKQASKKAAGASA